MGGRADGPPNEIDAMHEPRCTEKRTSGAAWKRVLLHRKPARRELALQDFTNLLMIGRAYEPRNGQRAEQLGIISHRARAR
jgi:hypothetical protein